MKNPSQAILIALLLTGGASLPQATRDIAIANSGGVSLGSNQAGYLYYFSLLNDTTHTYNPTIITGASAGTINAFMAGYYSFFPLENDFEKSFYYRWVSIGLDSLVNPGKIALLKGDKFMAIAEELFAKWFASTPPDSAKDKAVVFGVAATRLIPRTVEIQKGLTVPKEDEKFQFVISWRRNGKDSGWNVNNWVDGKELSNGIPVLNFGSGKDVSKFSPVLKSLLLASSAFPAAFPHVRIRYGIMTKGGCADIQSGEMGWEAVKRKCPGLLEMDASFVDGGLFENIPIRLAMRLAQKDAAMKSDSSQPDSASPACASQVRTVDNVLFVNPHHAVYATGVKRTQKPPEYFLDTWGTFFAGYYASNFDRELMLANADNPDLSTLVIQSRNHLPTSSAYFANFFGFLDIGFRQFDFVVGLYDAYRDFSNPEVAQTRIQGLPAVKDNRFQCLQGIMEEVEGERFARFEHHPACMANPEDEPKKREFANFKTLLQVSVVMIRLFEAVSGDAYHEPEWDQFNLSGKENPLSKGDREELKNWAETDARTDMLLKLLSAYEYSFTGFARKGKMSEKNIRKEVGRLGLMHGNELIANQEGIVGPSLARTGLRLSLRNFGFVQKLWYLRLQYGWDGLVIGLSGVHPARFTADHPLLGRFAMGGSLIARDHGINHRVVWPKEYGALGGIEVLAIGRPLVQARIMAQTGWMRNRGTDSEEDFSYAKHDLLGQLTFLDFFSTSVGYAWHDERAESFNGWLLRFGYQL